MVKQRGPATRRQVALLAMLVVAFIVSARATSGVLLRTPNGAAIIVSADSQLTGSNGAIITDCKIMQIEEHHWAFMSGMTFAARAKFYAYGVAVRAATGHRNNLDAIVSEFQATVMRALPSIAIAIRKDIGPARFRTKYEIEGAPILEAAFWGLEDKELKLATIDFMVRGGVGKEIIKIVPEIRNCPGNYCPPSSTPGVLPLGSHKFIDAFMNDSSHATWLRSQDVDGLPRQLVQMEIDNDRDCHCSPPIDVLHMDLTRTYWAGEHGPSCKEPY